MKVKEVAVVPKKVYPDQRISYYEITATSAEASGSVQAGADEPVLTFKAKWCVRAVGRSATRLDLPNRSRLGSAPTVT